MVHYVSFYRSKVYFRAIYFKNLKFKDQKMSFKKSYEKVRNINNNPHYSTSYTTLMSNPYFGQICGNFTCNVNQNDSFNLNLTCSIGNKDFMSLLDGLIILKGSTIQIEYVSEN